MLEELAVMVERGFAEARKDLDIFRAEAKKDIEIFRREVNHRFDRLEFHMNAHERRIEILEGKVPLISTKVGLRR